MADVEKIAAGLRERAEWRAANEGPFTKQNLVEWRAADELDRLRTRVAELEAAVSISEFGQRLVASQTPVEPEFTEALYANRSEMYRTFEPGAIRICAMRDGPCPHGLHCPYVGDGYMGYPCKEGWNGPRALSTQVEERE